VFIMGLFSDLFGKNTGSDPKTRVTHDGKEVRVRNSNVIYDRSSGKHDTAWSNTTVNVNTGKSTSSEGAHGPNFQK